MSALFELIPPIPAHWKETTPYAVHKEWSVPEEPVNPRYLPPPKSEAARASREYQRAYGILNREKLTQKKREWYAKKGNAKRQQKREKERLEKKEEEMRAAAVRTMVAMGEAKSPLDSYELVERESELFRL